jgi:hypothetical protein
VPREKNNPNGMAAASLKQNATNNALNVTSSNNGSSTELQCLSYGSDHSLIIAYLLSASGRAGKTSAAIAAAAAKQSSYNAWHS